MALTEEEKRRIIDLHFHEGKTIREVCRIMGKSSHDITPVTKEHRIRLAQNYALTTGEQNEVVEPFDYQELESVVKSEVEKTLSNNKKFLQNALFSVLLALRNDPD